MPIDSDGFEYTNFATHPIGGTIYYQEGENGYILCSPSFLRNNITTHILPIFNRPIRMHKAMVTPLTNALRTIEVFGFSQYIKTFDGLFVPRHIKRDITRPLSNHSWGIAIDINAEENKQGTVGNQHPFVVNTFKKAGFRWGGDWAMPSIDPMHFELF